MTTFRGRFDDHGRPLLDARVTLPGQERPTGVTFLVGTGTPRSALGPEDLARMPGDMPDPGRDLQATLEFQGEEPGSSHRMETTLAQGHQSVLGWDVICQWSMQYSYPRQLLEFRVPERTG